MDRSNHHSPRHVPPTAVDSDGTGSDVVQRPKPDKEQNERCTSGTAGLSARAKGHQHNGWYRSTTPSGECMGDTQQPTSTTTKYLWEQLQLWDAVVGRGFTTSGEGMENNQQPTTTTTPYLCEQLQLHNVVAGRIFTTSSEDMGERPAVEKHHHSVPVAAGELLNKIHCESVGVTSSATQQSREERACTQQAIP